MEAEKENLDKEHILNISIMKVKAITTLEALDAQNIQTMRKKDIQTMRKKKELQRLGLQWLIPAERCRIED